MYPLVELINLQFAGEVTVGRLVVLLQDVALGALWASSSCGDFDSDSAALGVSRGRDFQTRLDGRRGGDQGNLSIAALSRVFVVVVRVKDTSQLVVMMVVVGLRRSGGRRDGAGRGHATGDRRGGGRSGHRAGHSHLGILIMMMVVVWVNVSDLSQFSQFVVVVVVCVRRGGGRRDGAGRGHTGRDRRGRSGGRATHSHLGILIMVMDVEDPVVVVVMLLLLGNELGVLRGLLSILSSFLCSLLHGVLSLCF